MGGLNLSSMIYKVLPMCGTCPAPTLDLARAPHTGLSSISHLRGNQRVRDGSKNMEKVKTLKTFCPLSFICITYGEIAPIYMSASSPPKLLMTQFHHHK